MGCVEVVARSAEGVCVCVGRVVGVGVGVGCLFVGWGLGVWN